MHFIFAIRIPTQKQTAITGSASSKQSPVKHANIALTITDIVQSIYYLHHNYNKTFYYENKDKILRKTKIFRNKISLFGNKVVTLQVGIHTNVKNMQSDMIKIIQDYMKTQPVEKAWIFGSFSRGEERPDSDVDILVAFDSNAKVSLFTIGGMYMDLKQLLGKEIDLVEEGTLLPFAIESAEKDRRLIYERRS